MKSVLVIDDDPDVRLLLGVVLERIGVTVLMASNGREGLQVYEDRQLDLVLLDAVLPEVNGFRVLETMRQRNPDVPIVMLTSRGEESDIIRGLELGATEYLTKPFSPAEIRVRCARWLGDGGSA